MEHKLTDTNILFLDIETVPQKQDFNELDSVEKALWLKKAKSIETTFPIPSSINVRASMLNLERSFASALLESYVNMDRPTSL